MPTHRPHPPLRNAAAALALLCAAATAADDCVHIPDPAAARSKAAAAAAGAAVDIGNVTLIELDGDYSRGSDAPRMAVAQRFFETHPDRYDFLVVFTTFEFDTGSALAFHNILRNDTQGIGMPPLDLGQQFGSAARLQGYIDMAATSRYPATSGEARSLGALSTFAHEILHRWGAKLSYRTDGGATSRALLGRDDSHWSYFLDSDASLMYGADWRLRDDGRFESVAVRQRYSALDLYMAGLAAPGEVPPMTLIRNGDGVATDLPRLGALSGGSAETVRIEQIIAAEGPRIPDAAHSPKDFRAALILLHRPGEHVPAETLVTLENTRIRLQQYFNQITEGRASLRLFNEPLQSAAPQLPAVLSGSAAAATPPGVAAAVAWIQQRQQADGHWQDRDSTALRDTAAVVQLLQQAAPDWPPLAAARSWIAARNPASFDAQRWKLLADPQAAADDLLAAQSADGGWGLAAGFTDANLDTAGVAEALARRDANSDSLQRALLQLGNRQNGDGSFAIGASGRGRLLPTLRAAHLFAASAQPAHQPIRDAATQWLAARQRADGAFADAGTGNSESALADTIELYRLVGRLPLPVTAAGSARDYVIAAQRSAGDWQGSIYLTATAALAQLLDNKANLAAAGAASVTPADPVDGDVLVLRVRVANTGSLIAPASIARWYDGDPDAGGSSIGTDQALPALSAGAAATLEQRWDSAGRPGAHTFWLVLDADNAIAEQSENDNRVALPFVVGAPPLQPDIAVDATRFTLNPAAIASLPSTVELSGEVRNLGSTPVAAARLALYDDTDPPQLLATTAVDLPARGSAPLQLTFTATRAATLRLRLVADPDGSVAEARENNNEAQLLLPFGPSLDLEVRDADLALLDAAPLQGRDVGFRVQVRNRGTLAAPDAPLRITLQQDASEEILFDGRITLEPGRTTERRVYWRARKPGAALLRVQLDAGGEIAELDENNNLAALPFTVAAQSGSDLAVVAQSLQFLPSPALQGQPLRLNVQLRNTGADAAGPFVVALFANDPRSGGQRLAQSAFAGLAAQAETTATLDIADLALAGDTSLFVVADADQAVAEADETNNTAQQTLNVLPFADIAVASAGMQLLPSAPAPGAAQEVRAVVRNLGAQTAHDVRVRLFEGSAENGVAVGADQVVTELAAGAEASVSWNWTFGLQPGARQLTLVADPADTVRENQELNNAAILPLTLQESGFYASERYFSPDGDGVRDATALYFARSGAGRIDVAIRNVAGRVVKRYDDVAAADAASGQLVWDGRDERGRVVADGVYLAELQTAGSKTAELALTLDTDRSSLVSATGTPLLVDARLPDGYAWFQPPAAQDLVFAREFTPSQHDFHAAIHRADSVTGVRATVMSSQWFVGHVARNGTDIDGALGAVDAESFSPDGRWIAFYVRNGERMELLVAATDQTDQIVLLSGNALPLEFQYNAQSPRFLDATHVIAGAWPQLSVYDLQTQARTDFRAVPGGRDLLAFAHGVYVYTNGRHNPPAFYVPRDAARPIVAFDGPAPLLGASISEDGTRAVLTRYSPQHESVNLFRTDSGSETPLLQRTPQPQVFTGVEAPGYRRSLIAQWIAADDSVLLIDAQERRVVIHTRDGVVRRTVALPAADGTLDLGPAPERFSGEHRRVNVAFGSDECDNNRIHCAAAVWADGGRRAQWFDPLTRRAVVLLASEHAGRVSCEIGLCVGYAPATLEAFAIDVDDGSYQRIAAMQRSDQIPADLQPRLRLLDGAALENDGRYRLAGGSVSAQPWRYAAAETLPYYQLDDNDDQLLAPAAQGQRSVSGLVNLAARISAEPTDRAIALSGIAADLNFAGYQLDWASPSAPTQWHAITPRLYDAVVADEFLTWIPPQPGRYLVRLSVFDKAGNATTRTTSTLSQFGSPVSNFGIDERYFSPNGDGIKDTLTARFTLGAAAQVSVRVLDGAGRVVRAENRVFDAGPNTFVWNGRDGDGALQADGAYVLDVGGLRYTVHVDTVAPSLQGWLRQPNLSDRGDGAPYAGPVEAVAAGTDTNFARSALELRARGTDSWHEVDLGDVAVANVRGYGVLAGKHVREVAYDRAGNRAVRELGEVVEQLLFTDCRANPVPPCDLAHTINAIGSTTPPSYAADFPDAITIVTDPAHFAVSVIDASDAISAIEIEMADTRRPGEWQLLATLPAQIASDPAAPQHRLLDLQLPLQNIPLGGDRRLRLVGLRSDGSRLQGDQLRVLINGLGDPVVLCPGVDPANMLPPYNTYFNLDHDGAQIAVPVYVPNAAADVELQLGAYSNLAQGGSWSLRPRAHFADAAVFRIAKSTIEADNSLAARAAIALPDQRLLAGKIIDFSTCNPDGGMNGGGGVAGRQTAAPVAGELCTATPSHRVALNAFASVESMDHYQLRIGAGSTATETLVDVDRPPNQPVPGSSWRWGHQYELATQQRTEGPYVAVSTATAYGGVRVAFERKSFQVDHDAPQVEWLWPAPGSRVCATSSQGGLPRLDLGGVTRSDSSTGAQIELKPHGSVDSERCLDSALSDRACPTPQINELPDRYGNIRLQAEGPGVAALNGLLDAQLRVMNWSGGVTCANAQFYLDSAVELGIAAPPEPEIATAQLDAAGKFIDAVPVLGVSTAGAARFRNASTDLIAREPLRVRASLHRVTGAGNHYTLQEEMATLLQNDAVEGRFQVSWNGRIGGAPAADGSYAVRIAAEDDCGWSDVRYFLVHADSTPPATAITDPLAGAAPTDAVVPISGTVTDAHFSSFAAAQPYWELAVEQAGQALPVGQGEDAVPQPAVLGRWSRGTAQQAGDYRLVAVDDFGNRSELRQPFAAPTPLQLLARAQLLPELFSPNGDGSLDRSELRIDLLAPALVDLRVRDEGGAVVATLAQAMAMPAGTTRLDWNGSALPDGSYQVEILAQAAAAPEIRETALLGAVLDTRAPQLSVLTPAGEVAAAGAGAAVTFRIDEAYPDRFDARLLTDDGTVQAQLAGGGSGVQTLAALSGRADGRYRIAIQAQDRAGNRGEIAQSFVLDATLPQAALTTPAEDSVLPRGGTAVRLVGTATDAQLDSYRVELLPGDSQNGALLASGATAVEAAELGRWSVAEADGDYRLRLSVRDRAGNESTAERRVAIDGTPPQVVIDTPANGAALAGRLHLLGTVQDAHLRDYVVAIATPGAALADNWTPLYRGLAAVSAGVLADIDLPLPDGDYVLRVLATDTTGATASARRDLRVDKAPPPAPLQLRVQVNGSDAALDWTPPDAGDLAGYAIYRNGTRLNTALQAAPRYIDANLPDGRWSYQITALDQAGNESAPSNRVEISVDRTPPAVEIHAPLSGTRVHGLVPVVATAYSADDFDSFTLSARRRDGGDTPRILAQGSLPRRNQLLAQWDSLAYAEETVVALRLSARDRAGNEAVREIDLVVDNLAPAAPQGLVATLQGGDGAIAWTANGEADLLGYLLYRNGQLVNASVPLPADLRGFALQANSYLDAALADGTHSYVVFAIDQAGNISAPSAPAGIGPLDNGPPHLSIDAPEAGTAFETRIDVRASSRDGDIASVQFAYRAAGTNDWTAIGAALTEAPYRLSWTPGALPRGDYEIRAVATDSGARSDPQPPQVLVRYADLTPPEPAGALQATADGDSVQLSWSASSSSDVVAYRIERYENDAWQPVADTSATTADDNGLADGRWIYRVRALDAGGNLSTGRSDAAEVFPLQLQPPFTPTDAATTRVQGRSPHPGQLALRRGEEAEQNAGNTTADGSFSLDALALTAGSNHFSVRVTSAEGDRSRSATASVRRSDAPAAPTGLQAGVSGPVVDLAWNANAETDLLGYRVQHNGGYVQADALATGLVADSIACCDAAQAADGDPATAWELATTFQPLAQDGATDPPLEIDLGAAQIVSALELDWSDAQTASGNLDLYARSEYGDWLRLVALRRASAASYLLSLPQPYRSDRLRLVVRAPTAAGGDAHLRLAEVRVRSWPLQTATTLQQSVLDGTHRYRVAAVNAAAQQSAWSASAEVGIGDTTPPDAVLLSGSLQDDTATLSWSASAAADVARYVLTRNGAPVAEIAAGAERRHSDAHLPLGSYAYEVIAYDAFDNASLPSNRVDLTVAGSGPGVPAALTVAAPPQGGSLGISWNAGAGNAPVRYLLRRATSADGPYAEIATPTTTSFSDAPLVDGTRYYYTVEAVDIAGNRSGASAPASGVPRDALPPAPPLLTYPVGGDGDLHIASERSLVCGRAEPGSLVELQRDGVASATVTAAAVAEVTDYVTPGTYIYSWLQLAADGWHLLDNGNGLRLVDLRSGQIETVAGDIRLAQWSAQGLTAYYLQDGRIQAKSPGGAVETLPLQAEEIRNFAVAADASRVLLLGRYAAGAAGAAEGLWWLRRDGSDAGAVSGFAGRTPDPDQPLLLRADARYAAVRTSDAQLLLVDLGSLRVTDAVTADLNIAPRWMPDGNLAFTRSEDDGTVTLWRYDVTTRRAEARLALPNFTQGVVWAADGSEFAVYGNARVQGRDAVDGSLHFDLTLPAYEINLATFAWAPTGRIVFIGSDGSYPPRLYSLQPPGAFCAGPLALQAGSNRIEATATDAAGNRSGLSRPIRLDVDGTALPDLAVAAADVFLLPATPAPGQPVTALATVRNRGTAAATAVAISAELLAPDGSRRLLSAPAPFNLAGGEARSLSLDLGVVEQTGYYQLHLAVDPAAQIAEADESNNTLELPFAVSGGSDPLLDVSIENRLLAPGEHLYGEARVTNPGNPFSGRVRVRVLAADGSAVADLGETNVAALAGGQVWTRALDWDSRSTLAGDYRLQAQLLRSDGSSLAQREAAFTLAAVRRIALAVTATPGSAATGTAVAIDSRLQFETGNALLSGAVLRTAVRDPAGAEVWSATQPLGTLQPGYQLSKVDTWTTQGAATGVHSVRVELSAPGFTQSSETSLTVFEPAAPAVLRGSLGLTPAARLVAGQPGGLAYRVDNAGAAALNGISLRLRVLRAATPPQPVFEREELVDLGAGGSHGQQVAIAAPPLALGSYTAVLDARLAGDAPGQWRDLARTSFATVDETPPEITVLTPLPGQLQPALVNLRALIIDRHADVALAQVRVDNGAWQPLSAAADGSWGLRLAGLTDGAHSLQLRARDRWDNESQTAALAFDVDATAPQIDIAGVAEGALSNQPLTPTITISDTHLDPAQTHVRLNGQDYVPDTPIVADGDYTIAVRAVDTAGNQSLASRHFRIDRTPPPLAITSPAEGSVVAEGSIAVQAASEAGAEVSLTVGAYQAVVTAAADGQAHFAGVPLIEGLNRIEAVARDAAGNASAPQAVNVRYEAAAALPLVGSLQPAQAELAHGEALLVALQLRNPGTQALAAQTLRLRALGADGTPLAQRDYARAFAAGETFADTPQFATTDWPPGRIDLQLELLHEGSWRPLAAQSLQLVDRTPPQLQALAPQAAAVVAAPLRLRAAAGDALSAPVTVQASIDDGAWIALDAAPGPAGTFESAPLSLADGAHRHALRARDAAGNETVLAAVAFTVDSTPPQIAIDGVADGDLLDHAVTPLIQISDPHPRSSTVRLNGQPYVSGTPVEHSGEYTLRVDAEDEAGNSATHSLVFTLDLDAPAVLVSEPVPDSTVTTAAQTIAGTTEPLADVAVDAPGLATVVRADASGAFRTAAATLLPGDNTLRLRATDRAGNIGAERIVQVRYQPPAGEVLGAQFLHGALEIRRGAALALHYRLHNDGAIALQATPLRVQLRDAAGGIAAQHEETLDLGAGAETLRETTFATTTLSAGTYRVEISAALRDAQGHSDWITLAGIDAVLLQSCTRPPDRLFADGFGDADTDALFCNGFESAARTRWSSLPHWLSALYAPAPLSPQAIAGDRS